MRLLSKQVILYTEMIHHLAITKNSHHKLFFNQEEHPIVLQLAGSNPENLAEAAKIAVKFGYDEINLNVGCPSPSVQAGSFGACLMREPSLVYQCMKRIKDAIPMTPISVKCRLGIDDLDTYEFVYNFIKEVSQNENVGHFIVHARKAYLKGLSPAENRTIPPLCYEKVYKLKEDFPHIEFTLNGGIKTIEEAKEILQKSKIDNCMIGRTAFENPYELIKIDNTIYGKNEHVPSREEIVVKYAEYLDKVETEGLQNGENANMRENGIDNISRSMLIKPILNMFHGIKHSNKYKQVLSDHKQIKKQRLCNIVKDALVYVNKSENAEGKEWARTI